MIDTRWRVETPEGVDLTLSHAGPVARAQAWLIDLVIKTGAAWVAAIVAVPFGGTGLAGYMVFVFLLTWLYSVAFEVWRDGATPGKRMLGLRVVHDDGTPVGWTASMLRSLIGYADALPFCYGVGLVSTLLSPEFKRLGDLAAGTVVVHDLKPGLRSWDRAGHHAAPPVRLLPDEQRAVVDFADRAEALTPERLEELAQLALPLTSGSGDPVQELIGQARWIAGYRDA